MEIYICRNNDQLGPYSIDQVNACLRDGSLVRADLAWYEGIADWAPLSTVPGVAAGPPPPPPIPVTAPPSLATEQTYQSYQDVPWYRRASVNSVFILLNVLSCGWFPGTLIVCAMVLTGDVFAKNPDKPGGAKAWGRGNRIAACILLLLYIVFVIVRGMYKNDTGPIR